MFDKFILPAHYHAACARRRADVTHLLITALESQVPEGYVLSVDQDKMYGNALLAIRPRNPQLGDRMISFIHAINYRHRVVDGEISYLPTEETIRAVGEIRGATLWSGDVQFGHGGRIVASTRVSCSLASMVRELVADVCAQAPFVDLRWQKCAADTVGKWDLMLGRHSVQTVLKTGSRYSTDVGTCPKTLAEAQEHARAAALLLIRSSHHERLAGLDDRIDEQTVNEREYAVYG